MEEEKKIKVVSKETLKNIVRCFRDGDELGEFTGALNRMAIDICRSGQIVLSVNEDEGVCLLLRQVAHFIGFLQQNAEVIQQLMKACQIDEFTQEELEEMNRTNQ